MKEFELELKKLKSLQEGMPLNYCTKEEFIELHCRWLEMEKTKCKNGESGAYYAHHPERYDEDLERATKRYCEYRRMLREKINYITTH